MEKMIGYARVSTGEQHLDLQLDSLKEAGCSKIFEDQISGTKETRPNLGSCLEYLRAGDTLVVWRLDRLGRNLKDLIEKVEVLKSKKVEIRSLKENIDTTTPTGKLTFHLFAALAEFERDVIRERTLAGLRSARARGRKGGRPRALTDEQLRMAADLMKNPATPISDVCNTLSVSRATLYRYITPTGEIRK